MSFFNYVQPAVLKAAKEIEAAKNDKTMPLPNAVETKPNVASTAGSMGTFDYSPGTYNGGNLPDVNNPDEVFADVTKRQKEFVIANLRPFEQELIKDLNSTDLIDAAPEDAAQQTEIAKGITTRNRDRFGFERSKVLENEQNRDIQRGAALNLAGGLNNARLEQDAINKQALNQLVNFASGINKSNLNSLGTAAQNETNRKNAYTTALAQTKAQRYGFLGNLFSMI